VEREGYPQAIIGPTVPDLDVRRIGPSTALAEHVDYLWRVAWRVGPEGFAQSVVPQPRVHLVAEHGPTPRLWVHGLTRSRFVRRLAGDGFALGGSFLPAMFAPVLRGDVGELAERVVPAAEVLGVDDRPVAEAILAGDRDDLVTMVGYWEGYLTEVGIVADPLAAELRALVALAETDPGLVRAEDLAARAGVSLRTLQRQFSAYVGLGPKWVLRRYRVLDAAAVAASGEHVDWADLASRLGFSDQAHLVRVFAEVVGEPPERYRGLVTPTGRSARS
jgi:AraC-like DNA-binding protein